MAVTRPVIVTDPGAIEQIGFDSLRADLPGWAPRDGDGLTAAIRAAALQAAEVRDVAADVSLADVFAPVAEKVHRIPPLYAYPASVSATVSVRDSAGYTIPAGMEVLVKTAGDDGVTFETVEAVVIAPGARTTGAGEVTLRAMAGREGVAGNGLTAANDAVAIRSFDFIETITLVGTSSGGADGETSDEYLERAADELALTAPNIVRPADFAAMARRVPAVARALAMNVTKQVNEIIEVTGSSGTAAGTLTDRAAGLTVTLTAAMAASALSAAFVARGYSVVSATGGPLGTAAIVVTLRGRTGYGPWQLGSTVNGQSVTFTETQKGGDSSLVPLAVTVAVVDENGAALSDLAKADVKTLLESMREEGFLVSVIDPTYTAIDVTFTAVTYAGEDPAAVAAAGVAAIQAYLSPATWGTVPEGETPGWLDRPVVRFQDISALLNNVPGLDYWTDLRIGLEGRTLGTADITMTGPAALPRPGSGIRGTATEG